MHNCCYVKYSILSHTFLTCQCTCKLNLYLRIIDPGDDISNPDLLGMEDGFATSKAQPSDHQPPLLNEGAGTVANKVDSEVHPNEVRLIVYMILKCPCLC